MKRLFVVFSIVAFLIPMDKTQTTASALRIANDQKCEEECKKRNREEVKLCNTLYPPKSQLEKHRKCLDDAKTTFDACMAACRA